MITRCRICDNAIDDWSAPFGRLLQRMIVGVCPHRSENLVEILTLNAVVAAVTIMSDIGAAHQLEYRLF